MKLTNTILLGSTLYFFIFSAYLELSPKLGNIWYRISDDGIRRINLQSYWYFITRPFSMISFWYPSNFDLNYFVGSSITVTILYGLFYYFDY